MFLEIKKALNSLANPNKALLLKRYFKTGKGQYGYGDKFLGITVPQQRKIAKQYQDIELVELEKLLSSKIHEHRFTALEILIFKYEKSNLKDKAKLVSFYLKNKKYINNWDLVDTSAPYILGSYLLDKDRSILYKLADSKNIWERRVAIVSTFAFIRNNDFKDSLDLSKKFLSDKHDLIHKATGWMLREIGKRSVYTLEDFLNNYSEIMPRMMLGYAIERLPEEKRKFYRRKGHTSVNLL